MAWIRHDDDTKNMKWLLGFLAVLFFMAMAFLQFTAASVIIFAAAVVCLQLLYSGRAGKKLVFQNERKRSRLLYGGESSWKLVFKNDGLPIWGGQLKIWFYDAVEPKDDRRASYGDLVELDLPFTIGSKQTIEIEVPVTGNKRGLSRIKKWK